jgi:cysteinyl-tRNA synthetase
MDQQGLALKDKERIKEYLDGINSAVGVMALTPVRHDKAIEELIIKREEARRIKDWETADRLRKELKDKMGIEVIDTKDGTIWR